MPRDLYRSHRRVLPLSASDIEAKQDHIAVLHDIIAALDLQQPGRLDGIAILMLLKDREGDDLGADEAPLHIGGTTPAACGAVQPRQMVQARVSFSLNVK